MSISAGVLYESAARAMSCAVIDQDPKAIKQIGGFLRKHFPRGSELRRELDAMRELAECKVSSPALAVRMIALTKVAIDSLDPGRLVAQRLDAIAEWHDVAPNSSSGGSLIYEHVDQLFSEWRKGDAMRLREVVRLEDTLVQTLVSVSSDSEPHLDEQEADPLVLKLMIEKLNKKYKNALAPCQLDLIRLIFESDLGIEGLVERLDQHKSDAMTAINKHINGKDKKGITTKALIEARDMIHLIDSASSDAHSKHIAIAGLLAELESDEE